jgi:hypothetical protein
MDKRQRLTLHELLASQTQCHLSAFLVICHPRTCSAGLGIRSVSPVFDVAKQDIGGSQQSTDSGPYRATGEERLV